MSKPEIVENEQSKGEATKEGLEILATIISRETRCEENESN